MTEQEQVGTYRALPAIDDDIEQFILQDESGPVVQFGEVLKDLGPALKRVDEELEGISEANPHLAHVITGTVDETYGVFAEMLESEQTKALLRAVAYFNAFVVLRALDMQWRRMESAKGDPV